jgi:hypothetical protein
LTVRAERLDARFEVTTAPSELPVTEAAVGLPLEIAAHVRNRGDMTFTRSAWAGRIDKGLWIESFSIHPLETIAASEIEYKSLTSSGFETPWISDAKLCGTQGMGVPLIGFAVRLKPGARASSYDVEYTGAFASGALVGPLRNGVPCRSTVANDPLEGLQIRVIRRGAGAKAKAVAPPSPVRAAATSVGSKGKSTRPSTTKKTSGAKAKAVTPSRAKPGRPTKSKAAGKAKSPAKKVSKSSRVKPQARPTAKATPAAKPASTSAIAVATRRVTRRAR